MNKCVETHFFEEILKDHKRQFSCRYFLSKCRMQGQIHLKLNRISEDDLLPNECVCLVHCICFCEDRESHL